MAKRREQPVEPEVLDAVPNPDLHLVQTDSDKLTSFLGGLTKFFSKAGELERSAKERLEAARKLKAPTDSASDEAIQNFIREAKDEGKAAEDHWVITAQIHSLHRRLTAARARTTGKDSKGLPVGMLDQAAAIAQGLHNRWVEDEKRREQREADDRRREAEDRARLERERETARLEEEAQKREAASPDLSEREETFVQLVDSGVAIIEAAKRAGFKDPNRGLAMAQQEKIIAALKARADARVLRQQATATKAMPLDVRVEPVQSNVTKAAGRSDRVTWSAELFDQEALLAAVLDPRQRLALGIPTDIITIDQVALNKHAVAMQRLIDKWPGVRANDKRTTV